ncbi:MAG: transposase [Fibrobacter sp.]|nr:transposase [Fibrobacter sp.]
MTEKERASEKWFQERLARISKLGGPLEQINNSIPWGEFETILRKAFDEYCKKHGENNGANPKAFGHLRIFKALVLRHCHELTDEQTEYLIMDSLSFRRFVGLSLNDAVPGSDVICNYRLMLEEMQIYDVIFSKLEQMMTEKELVLQKGTYIVEFSDNKGR